MQIGGDQPPFISLESYEDIDSVRSKFPPLASINLNHNFDNLERSRFFIIRTQGEDNVHRAMKYGIWTSSSRKNERLNEAFKSAREKRGDVYLFFTEINSMCFSGMAKITSEFDPKSHFKYWLIENKWFGLFRIKWLYIKDLQFKLFEDIRQVQKLEGSEEALKSVYDLIDCTELLLENGLRMVQIFQKEQSKKSLFEDFPQLDKLEHESRLERTNNQRFERKFKELAQVFESIPFSFSVASYERKKMQRKQQVQYYNQYGGYYGYGYQYQGGYGGYGFQQTPQYWQANNGFYQNQYMYPQNPPQPRGAQGREQRDHYQQQGGSSGPEEHDSSEQQQQNDYQNVPLEHRFQFKNSQKKVKNQDKRKRGQNNSTGNSSNQAQTQYVQKHQQNLDVEQKN